MSYYYVAHPNLDFSATVKAPSTDKARTTYLDFLERSGRMNRKDRQSLRRNLIADRIEFPEEVDTDVRLNYDYTGDNGESNIIQVGRDGSVDVGGVEASEAPEEEDYYGDEEEPELEMEPEPTSRGDESGIAETPIGRMSLGSA